MSAKREMRPVQPVRLQASGPNSWRTLGKPICLHLRDDVERPLQFILVILLTTLIGSYGYTQAAGVDPPPEPRTIHPAPPASISFRGKTIVIPGLENPLRRDAANFQRYVREGGEVYFKNCVFCHGDHLDGKGQFAHGFNPPPADFTNPGTIATLQESYLLWRIAKGGPGLPKESRPWDSAMPAWEDNLSEEEIWRVILFLYEATGMTPRRWEPSAHPAPRTPHPALSSDAWAQQDGGGQELGKQVYEKRCAFCHGFDGKGDGVAAPFLKPRPRDFTRGLYKIRSTPTGTLPTDDDLLTIITEGMPGTSMPPWKNLPERERRAVVQYIKRFSDRFRNEPFRTPIHIGKQIRASKQSLEKGRQLYQAMACFVCHGKEGRADGPASPTLKDELGNKIRPANLTKRWNFRGGSSVRAIFTRFNTGLAGTPMPSYADSITAEQSWHLSNYVASLGPEQPNYGAVLTAKLARRGLPTTPTDPLWKQISAVNFPLVGQVIVDPRHFTPSIDMVSVKAVYNDKTVALLLSWDDPTPGQPAIGGQAVPDAFALQFPGKPTEGGERPYFLMGDPDHPTYLIRWRSDVGRVEELTAAGSGQIKEAIPASKEKGATGAAVYHEGEYRLLVTRPLASHGEGMPEFQRARFIPMAFFAWDGDNGETGSKMSISAWYYLFLEEPTSAKRLAFPALAATVTVTLGLLIVRGAQRRDQAQRR